MKWTNSEIPRRNSHLVRNSNDDKNINQFTQNNLQHETGFQKNLIHDLRSELNCLKSQFMKLTSKNSVGPRNQQQNPHPHPNRQETNRSKFQRDANKPAYNNKKQPEKNYLRQSYSGQPSYISRNLSQSKLHSANSHQKIAENVNISNEYQMNFPQKYIKNPSKLLLEKQESQKFDASVLQSQDSLLKKEKSSSKIGVQLRQQLSRENEQLRKRHQELEDRLNELNQFNKKQAIDLAKSQQKMKALAVEKGQAKRLLSEIEKERNQLLFKLETNEKQLQKIRKQKDEQKLFSENKVKELHIVLVAKQAHIDEFKQKEEIFFNENKSLVKDLENKMQEIQDKNKQIQLLAQQVKLGKEFEQQYREKIVAVSRQQKKEKQINHVNEEFEKELEQYKQRVKNIESQNKQKKYQNNELVKILNEKQNMIRNMLRDIKNLEKEVNEIKRVNRTLEHILKEDSQNILRLNLSDLNSRFSKKIGIEEIHIS